MIYRSGGAEAAPVVLFVAVVADDSRLLASRPWELLVDLPRGLLPWLLPVPVPEGPCALPP